MKSFITFFAMIIYTQLFVYSQGNIDPSSDTALFESQEILEVKLQANFEKLLKDRSDERPSYTAVLTYIDESGEEIQMDNLKLKIRGNFRRKRSTCSFPPLRINFAKKKTKGTIFEGQDKLKLVTHCQTKSAIFEQYTLQEQLIYKMYNLISEYSFRTRLIRITYIDSAEKYAPFAKYAFLIEDEDLMVDRLGGKIQELPGIPPTLLDQKTMGLLGVFQYMIGNTDWSVPYGHNIKTMTKERMDKIIPIPYDFDWAGIISAPYAQPNPMFGTQSVKQRVYRGFCIDDKLEESILEKFISQKAAIIALVEEDSLLNEKVKKRNLKYLYGFFKIIEAPKSRENLIFAQCRD